MRPITAREIPRRTRVLEQAGLGDWVGLLTGTPGKEASQVTLIKEKLNRALYPEKEDEIIGAISASIVRVLLDNAELIFPEEMLSL